MLLVCGISFFSLLCGLLWCCMLICVYFGLRHVVWILLLLDFGWLGVLVLMVTVLIVLLIAFNVVVCVI